MVQVSERGTPCVGRGCATQSGGDDDGTRARVYCRVVGWLVATVEECYGVLLVVRSLLANVSCVWR